MTFRFLYGRDWFDVSWQSRDFFLFILENLLQKKWPFQVFQLFKLLFVSLKSLILCWKWFQTVEWSLILLLDHLVHRWGSFFLSLKAFCHQSKIYVLSRQRIINLLSCIAVSSPSKPFSWLIALKLFQHKKISSFLPLHHSGIKLTMKNC